MSAPTTAAARDAAERGASKLDTVLYHFFAKTVAMVHESRGVARSVENRGRPNKWFSFELPECEVFRQELRPWRTLSTATCPPPLVVDVCLQTADVEEDYEVHARTSTGTQRLVAASNNEIILERWRLDLQLQDAHHAERLPAVYKQAIVHFRTLFSMTRLLPAWRLAHRLQKARGASAQLALQIQVRSEAPPLAMPASSWTMEPIQTPLGALAFGIDYCDVQDIVLQCRNARLPANARMHTAPPAIGVDTGAASPLFQAMLAQDNGARRAIHMGRPRTNSLSTSPSLAASRFSRSPRIGGSASPSAVSPRPSTASTGLEALGASTLSMAEPGALRALFSSSARNHASPSSLRSLRTPPMYTGSFDLHMQGKSPMARSRLGESPGRDEMVPRARPQRIERYSRQLSYRQRELSQSTGPTDIAAPARSWSQRSERRRNTDWAAASPHSHSLGGVSPGMSRVFAGPSPSPAFALPRPPLSPSQHTPSSSDDVLDLVAMIDTRTPGPTPAPTASVTRAPEPLLSEHYYDDVLAKMSHSLKLLALDDSLGPRPNAEAHDEAAGQMEWSLNM